MTATRDKPWQSLAAGLFAGGVEGFITYPAEMVKTAAQFSASRGAGPVSPIDIIKTTWSARGVRGFYSGCGALCVGNSAKAGVRFLSYGSIKDVLKDPLSGKLSTGNSLLAGMIAGALEAVVAVTPSETVKTRLIDDAKRVKPRFEGSATGALMIVREEGLSGIYKGVAPTIAKQAANSAVRFTSYNSLVTLLQRVSGTEGQKLSTVSTFACGAGAGTITVYATMPFDVVKTRMQSLSSAKYSSSFDCLRKIVGHDGVKALWSGSTARLSRLMLSGGIVFAVFEKCMDGFRLLDGRELS